MFEKLKEAANSARLRAGQMWREHRERAEERKQATEPPGVTIPLSLVRSAKLASWMAYFCLVYFLWLYTLDIARDRAGELHLTHVGSWIGELSFYFPYIIGFALVAVGIPYVAKIALPTFMSLSWHDNAWAKSWALFIVLCVSSVIIAGTFTVQGDTIMERDRESAVAVEGVQQEAAVLASRIADRRTELEDMTRNESVYVRTAASMSPEAYDVFLEQRRDDWQYDRLRSYRATSVDAQRLRDEIAALRDQQARQTTVASVQGEVVTERTDWIADALGWLEGVRAILLSLVMDIVCLVMPWIALRLEQARNRQLGMADPGRDLHPSMLLDDLTDEPSIMDTTPGAAARAVFAAGGTREEAETAAREAARVSTRRRKYEDMTGEDITEYVEKAGGKMVAMPKRDPRTGKFVGQVKTGPRGAQKDETGVDHDGGARIASVPPGRDASGAAHVPGAALNVPSPELAISEPVADNVQAPSEEGAESQRADNGDSNNEPHPEPSTDPAPLETLSDEQLDELLALESAAADANADVDVSAPIQVGASDEVIVPAEQDAQVADAADQTNHTDNEENNEPVDQNDTPITDERRLIGVAAE